eukprot:473653-Amphidinium_carterae.1
MAGVRTGTQGGKGRLESDQKYFVSDEGRNFNESHTSEDIAHMLRSLLNTYMSKCGEKVGADVRASKLGL